MAKFRFPACMAPMPAMALSRTGRTAALGALFSAALLAALPASAGASQAQGMDGVDSLRFLSDPAYLPEQGQLYGTTLLDFGLTTADVAGYFGAMKFSYSTTSLAETQTLAYGLLDDLTVRVEDSYESADKVEDNALLNQSSYINAGPLEPTLGATWRSLDCRLRPMNWDWTASFSPDCFPSHASSSTKIGSEARGGADWSLGSALSRVTRDYTLSFYALATEDLSSSTLNTNGTTTTYGDGWQYQFELNSQLRLSSLVSVNVGLTEILNTNEASQVSPNIDFTNAPADLFVVNAALNVHILPKRLVASGIYVLDLFGSSSQTYPVKNTLNTSTGDEVQNHFEARLDWVLF